VDEKNVEETLKTIALNAQGEKAWN
jgi:hypothetical protein